MVITYWGDDLAAPTNEPQHCRIGFANIHGFRLTSRSHKNQEFYSFISNFQFDIFGMAETNVNWSAVPVHDRPHERSRSWWQLRHVSYSHLIHDKALRQERFQYGGTAVWTRDSMVRRVATCGKDTLGRWSWTRYRRSILPLR